MTLEKADIRLSNNYKIAETDTFSRRIGNGKYKFLYEKIKEYIYPILRNNPFFHHNIKKLKGELDGFYRFRIGKYRLFYTVDKGKVTVFIVDLRERKDAYRK